MTEPFVQSLLNKTGLRKRTTQPNSCFGTRIGIIDQRDTYCWNLAGALRTLFDDQLWPNIRQFLEAFFESGHRGECLTVSGYLVGRSEETARPTVLFISGCLQTRKDAQRAVKSSGILADFPIFKTAIIAKDPGLSALCPPTAVLAGRSGPQTMELLASHVQDFENQEEGNSDATQRILYDSCQDLRFQGQAIYVQCGPGLRLATGNIVYHQHRFCFQTVQHVFAPSDASVGVAHLDHLVDNGFEIDTDSDDDDDVIDTKEDLSLVEAISSGSCSSKSSSDSSTAEEKSIQGDMKPERLEPSPKHPTSFESNHTEYNISFDRFEKTRLDPSSRTDLAILGHLLENSIDKDWALIELTRHVLRKHDVIARYHGQTLFSIFQASQIEFSNLSRIRTCTATGGDMTGALLKPPSWTQMPGSRVFEKLYRVQLDGGLRPGDSSSVVIDNATGQVLSHIVAGSSETSIAYVMGANCVISSSEQELAVEKGNSMLSSYSLNTQIGAAATPLQALLQLEPQLTNLDAPIQIRWSDYNINPSVPSHSRSSQYTAASSGSNALSSIFSRSGSISSQESTFSSIPEGLGHFPGGKDDKEPVNASMPLQAHHFRSCVSRNRLRTRRHLPVQIYFCTSCSEPFKEKADWKRHEEEYQERREMFLCNLCQAMYFLDKNFKYHHKACHGCRACATWQRENKHVELARRSRRLRTGWGCGFCCHFSDNWTERCNHIAYHFGSEGRTMADWNHSFVIYSLLQRPVVQVEWKTLLASHHRIIFRLSWAPSTTGRVEGYPENQQAPQLQDLLEYYTNIEENAQAVAGAAFNSAVKKYELMPRLLLPPLPPPEDQPDDSGRSARETADAEESLKGVCKAIEYDVADSWI